MAQGVVDVHAVIPRADAVDAVRWSASIPHACWGPKTAAALRRGTLRRPARLQAPLRCAVLRAPPPSSALSLHPRPPCCPPRAAHQQVVRFQEWQQKLPPTFTMRADYSTDTPDGQVSVDVSGW